MGDRSLGDRQDQIIGGFHHGGALALREPRKSLSPKFEFLRRGTAIILSGSCYATRQGTVRSSYLGV
jgi:hypothetical protein